MVRHGMTPMQVLEAATVNAADLIAVEGDPLRDVMVLKRVAFVMKDGAVFKDARGAR